MFFRNNSAVEDELKEEIQEKDEQIETLHTALKKMNSEFDKKIEDKTQIINSLNRKLNAKTEEIELIKKELDHRSRELTEALDNLERITNSDTLTGAYNKRYFYDVAESVISLAKREKQPLSIAVIEINKFKEINQTYGYKIGDNVLQTFVHKVAMRESDVFVRFNEKRFVVLFPNTNIENALVILEKIRKDIESCVFVKNIPVSVSIGVSEFSLSEDNINDALNKAKTALEEAADNALVCYDAKEA